MHIVIIALKMCIVVINQLSSSITSWANLFEGDEVDCGEDGLEDDSYYPKDDFPIELLSLLEDKSVNWDIEERDAVATMLYGSKYSPKALRPDKILDAKKKYLLDVHMDPIRYHHLYMYFANR